ncbi:MAG: tetratricopeptide repeat protein [Gemmatimonadota bacterium]|nr:MAG: tetratricopeptide repeat protein [Gemmatimonadota bacterium]
MLYRVLSAALALLALVTSRPAAQSLADAETAFRSGRYEDAISLYARLAEGEPASVAIVRGWARALAEVGRYADAERVARAHAESFPDSPELWNTLGEARYARGEVNGAAEAFRRAIQDEASDALEARLNLAILRYERGEREAALSEFDYFIDFYNRAESLTSEELTVVASAVRYLGVEEPELYQDALRAYDEAIDADPGNLEPRVKVGDLFLEKYRSGDAAKEFEDVLAVNPRHPLALLGTARRMRFDGEPGAAEMARRGLEVNPNLVAARVTVAELLLELEDYDAAIAELRRALEVNPSSLEALAVLAASRYLQGDVGGFDEARRRVSSINPVYAGLYNKLAEASARNRRYQEAAEFARQAVELDGKSWRGFALLGINQLRIGEIEQGKQNLEVAFRGDPYDVWTKNTLDLLDTFDDYSETRTGRFVLAMAGQESALLSIYLADLADDAFERLAGLYGYRPATPIRVELYRSHADFSVRTVGLVGLGALGVSFGPVIAMDSPSARQAGEFNWGSTFWHELAHTFHLGMSDHRVPRWFSEGLAVYEERRAMPGWGDDVSPGFLTAHLRGQLLSIGELNSGFTRPTYPEQVGYSYYQASLVCEFIEREAGPQALVSMLNGYGQGLSTVQVFRQVLAADVDEVSDRFFVYLEERFAGPLAAMRPARRLPHGENPPRELLAEWAKNDPGDYYAQLAFGRTLLEEDVLADAIVHLKRAKSLFPEYAGPGSPYWHLAAAYRKAGDLAAAAAELEALTGINEHEYQANLMLADLRERLGDKRGAAAALERIIFIYPYELDLHARLANLYADLGEWGGAIRERKAALALDPVDRAEALYQLALAQWKSGASDEARRTVLQALESAPSFEAALELLLEIRGSTEERPR